jgi:hypothetical protein
LAWDETLATLVSTDNDTDLTQEYEHVEYNRNRNA